MPKPNIIVHLNYHHNVTFLAKKNSVSLLKNDVKSFETTFFLKNWTPLSCRSGGQKALKLKKNTFFSTKLISGLRTDDFTPLLYLRF